MNGYSLSDVSGKLCENSEIAKANPFCKAFPTEEAEAGNIFILNPWMSFKYTLMFSGDPNAKLELF